MLLFYFLFFIKNYTESIQICAFVGQLSINPTSCIIKAAIKIIINHNYAITTLLVTTQNRGQREHNHTGRFKAKKIDCQ